MKEIPSAKRIFPSGAEAYNSTISSSEETNNSGKFVLFKSLTKNADSISTSVNSTKECIQLNVQGQMYNSKIGDKISTNYNKRDAYKNISDYSINSVVEGVEKLDIQQSIKV